VRRALRTASGRWSAPSSSSIFRAGAIHVRQGHGVRPHPHIGLATVSYLFDGTIMHRDSEGNIREIQPGAMNLMTRAAHRPFERTPDLQRKNGQKMLACRAGFALTRGLGGNRTLVPALRGRDLPRCQLTRRHRARHRGQSFGAKSRLRWCRRGSMPSDRRNKHQRPARRRPRRARHLCG